MEVPLINVFINISFQIRGYNELAVFYVLLHLNNIKTEIHSVDPDNSFIAFPFDVPLMPILDTAFLRKDAANPQHFIFKVWQKVCLYIYIYIYSMETYMYVRMK